MIEGYFDLLVVCVPRLLQEKFKALECPELNVELGCMVAKSFAKMPLFAKHLMILHKEIPDALLTNNILPNVYGHSLSDVGDSLCCPDMVENKERV